MVSPVWTSLPYLWKGDGERWVVLAAMRFISLLLIAPHKVGYCYSFLLEGKQVQERWLTEGYIARKRWGQDTNLGLSGSKVSKKKIFFILMAPLANVPACLWNDWESQIRLANGLWKKCHKICRCQRWFILRETGAYPEAAGENSKLLDEEHRSVEVTRMSHVAFSNSSSASHLTEG